MFYELKNEGADTRIEEIHTKIGKSIIDAVRVTWTKYNIGHRESLRTIFEPSSENLQTVVARAAFNIQ